jgi:type II secretory pathway pseudopilin PulG
MFALRWVGRPARRPRGMTLVETVVVLGFIGIMGAIALPSLVTWRRDLLLDQAVQKVRFELHLAQIESVKRNQPLSFYRLGANTYRIGTGPKRKLPIPVEFAAGPDSVGFAPFGPPPTGAAEFTLRHRDRTRVVEVSLAGHVGVR